MDETGRTVAWASRSVKEIWRCEKYRGNGRNLEAGSRHKGHRSQALRAGQRAISNAVSSHHELAAYLLSEIFSWRLGSCSSTCRRLLHHLEHLLLHFLGCRFSPMRCHHPGVAIKIYNSAAAITPEHVHDLTLRGCTEVDRFIDDLVDIFYIDKQAGGRCSDTLRC
jgi:hypothetical protein